MLACGLCDWHLPCTAPRRIAPGNPMAELQRQPRSIVGSAAGCRRGMVVRWVPLRAKASVWHCATVHWPTDRQTGSPGCQHLLQRLYHLPEAQRGRRGGREAGGTQNISPVSPKQCNQRQDAAGLAVFYLKCVIITDKLNSCSSGLRGKMHVTQPSLHFCHLLWRCLSHCTRTKQDQTVEWNALMF